MTDEKKYANPDQISLLLREPIDRLDELVRKERMPRRGRSRYDVVQVVHWLIDRQRRELEAEKMRRNRRSLEEISDLFLLEPRWINRLAKEHGLPREGRGQYDLIKVVRWYVSYLKRQIDEIRAGGEDGLQAKARLIKSQANIKEMEEAKLRKQVINVADAASIVEEALSILRTRLLTLHKRAAPQLDGLETIGEREEVIKGIIYESLTDLSNIPDSIRHVAVLSHGRAAESVQDAAPAAAADHKRLGRGKAHPIARNRKRTRKV